MFEEEESKTKSLINELKIGKKVQKLKILNEIKILKN